MSWHKGERPSGRQWRAVRLKALDRDGWKCTACGKSGRLEVHHLVSLDQAPEKAFALENLESNCKNCHIKRHGGRVPSPEVLAWRRHLTSLLHVVYTL